MMISASCMIFDVESYSEVKTRVPWEFDGETRKPKQSPLGMPKWENWVWKSVEEVNVGELF